MFEYVNALGYDIVDIGHNQWLLDVKGVKKYHGTFNEVIKFCIKRYGFEINELEFAIETMLSSNDNTMTFGAYKNFLYSTEKSVDYVKKAS